MADFGSVGTNDLIQYLFAVDRNSAAVADDCNPDRTVFWSLMADLVRAANETGTPLSVCGEATGDPALLMKFMDVGIRTVSVSSALISRLRTAVSQRPVA